MPDERLRAPEREHFAVLHARGDRVTEAPRAVFGLRPHSGWAALVAVAGSRSAPAVIDRRRIEIADPEIPGSKQPYHAAEDLELKDSRRLLSRCEAGAKRLARKALREAVDGLRKRGYEPVGCGMLLASGRPLPALPSILASHALIHTADGEHFRAALAGASEECGLALTRVRERELPARASEKLRLSTEALQRRVTELGRSIGPPWTQDQKLATLVAWLVLATLPRRPPTFGRSAAG